MVKLTIETVTVVTPYLAYCVYVHIYTFDHAVYIVID